MKKGEYKSLTDEKIEWAYEKWCEGYTQQQIANALYVALPTINRYLRQRKKVRPTLVYTGGDNNG